MKTMKTNPIIKIATLALLLIAGAGIFQAKAQYQSFFGDSLTIYNVQGMGVSKGTSTDDIELIPGNTYEYGLFTRDTVNINGHRYYRFYSEHWEYLREDTATGRIYRYSPDDEEEILTCDMSLSVGDTFWMPFDKSYYYDSRPVPIVVDTIYFVNGLKTIQFRTIYECGSMWSDDPTPCPTLFGVEVHHHPIIFVEGIGPNFSPFGWLNDAFEECNGSCFTGEQELHCGYGHWNPFLLCVYKDRELVFMSDAQIGCWQDNNISIQENQPLPFSIYPNPTTHTLTVETASPIREITVYDLAGRVMMTAEGGTVETCHGASLQVDVSSLPNGIYLLRAVTDNGVETGRFVKN